VPSAGPADPVSFALANALVGNAAGSGALEITGGGTRLRALAACHVAVAGAAPGLRVDGSTVPAGQVVPLAAGQELAVGPLQRGCRSHLSVAGGILGPEVFGSSASDELTGLGPGPLGTGARLHVGPWTPPLGDHLTAGAATELDEGGRPWSCGSCRARIPSNSCPMRWRGSPTWSSVSNVTATAWGSGCEPSSARPICAGQELKRASSTRRGS